MVSLGEGRVPDHIPSLTQRHKSLAPFIPLSAETGKEKRHKNVQDPFAQMSVQNTQKDQGIAGP